MRSLYTDKYYEAHLDQEGFVRLRRTDTRIEDLQALQTSLRGLVASISTGLGGEARPGILMDFRDVPPRNDAAFEDLTSRYRQLLQRGFRRVAILARTQVGRLHIARLDRQEGTTTPTFQDEAEALAYLRGSR